MVGGCRGNCTGMCQKLTRGFCSRRMYAACFNAGAGHNQVYNDVANVLWLAAMAPALLTAFRFRSISTVLAKPGLMLWRT